MRLTICSLLAALMLTVTGWSAGVAAGGIIGVGDDDGEGGYSEPVPIGQDLTLTAVVLNEATYVKFGAFDSNGNLIYVSNSMPVQDNLVTMSWSPPFVDTSMLSVTTVEVSYLGNRY